MNAADPPTSHPLIHAADADDAALASQRLSRAVESAELLRLRRGVYVDPATWLRSAPWDRHLLATAATHLADDGAVFRRETALAVHGVHQLRSPEAVHVRTWRRQEAGTQRHPPMTGSAAPARVDAVLRSTPGPHRGVRRRDTGPADLQGVPAKKVFAFSTMRRLAQRGRVPDPVRHAMPGIDEHTLDTLFPRVEPLGLVLADTVSRMDSTSAAVVVDSVRSGRCTGGHLWTREDMERWLAMIPSKRGMLRWEQAWDRSAAGAESVGESLLRLRAEQLGFEVPETQVEFALPDGRVARVDAYWRSVGIVGEFDGWTKYTRNGVLQGRDVSEVVYGEKVREDGLRALGLGVARFTWQDVQSLNRLSRKLSTAGVPRV
ncbi:hypothetical protein Q7C18_01220 [Nesterenkonia sp. CL21]|uniref:hypothetical protein n=1 Tax=Nesterenkonia sp. CL21 TaxID=3064894 RepID=UPI00287B0028|nr:hypothetical protein [Nesterenkonia sp. CL21]MDS2171316.1 hypothetical protein [Nesterenkonia sp. CL21]